MEPRAPGTEDEAPIMYSTLKKQETEQDRILNQKAVLKNGLYGNVFDLTIDNGVERYFCRVCECPVMGKIFQHENGRRHTQNFANANRHLEHEPKTPKIVREEPEIIDVAPGEPVPPGFEVEVVQDCKIQEKLEAFKSGPLVGLEYVIELQDYDETLEPSYLCTLCDKRGDTCTIVTHLLSYNHIVQYFLRHFPTCFRSLGPYKTRQYKRNWQMTLLKIAEAIEKKFGRMKPIAVENYKFDKDRLHYLNLITKGKHFHEQFGCTFEELVVHEELIKGTEDEKAYETSSSNNWGGAAALERNAKKKSPSPPVVAVPSKKPKGQQPAFFAATTAKTKGPSPQARKPVQNRRNSLSSVSSDDNLEKSESGERQQAGKTAMKKSSTTEMPYERHIPLSSNRSSSTKHKQSPKRRSPSPRRRRRRSPSPRRPRSPRRRSPSSRTRRGDGSGIKNTSAEDTEKKRAEQEQEKIRKIEEFRRLARAIENDMTKTLQKHEKNPEKHPQYNEEWKNFWNRRFKELHAQGVDVAKYDFKPEWIEFWNRRMVELHSDELRKRKDALRKRLALPEEIDPITFAIGTVQMSPSLKPNDPVADQDDQIMKEDNDRSPSRDRSSSYSSRTRDLSPQSRETRRRVSPSPRRDDERDSRFRDRRDRDVDSRGRRSHSRERSRERRDFDRKKTKYRESSYERDIKGRERVRTVADLPWEREKVYRHHLFEEFYKPPPIMRDATRLPSRSEQSMILPPEEDDDDAEVTVIDVLRILTAIEERLGSLGPKVVDLLSRALALEKKVANSSETLLNNDMNCVLFETIKEKLKGQLISGLVDIFQERAFRKAIKKIASLLHMVGRKKRQPQKSSAKDNVVTVPGVGNVDRAAIAKQIANALIAQGKTDVTQAELEQLINAVVGMAEKARHSNQPVAAASFQQGKNNNSLPKECESQDTSEKMIIPSKQSAENLTEPPSSLKKKQSAELGNLTEPVTPSPGKKSIKDIEHLSDSDLQTLLQNFRDLSKNEQHDLIDYLKKMEYEEPERVEKLKQFVYGEGSKSEENSTKSSGITDKHQQENPEEVKVKIEVDSDEEEVKVKMEIDSEEEEEENTFEDVKKVKNDVEGKESKSSEKFDSLSSNFSLSSVPTNAPNTSISTAYFAKNFNGMNVNSSTVKNISSRENTEKPLNFEPPSSLRNTKSLKFEPPVIHKTLSPKIGKSFQNDGLECFDRYDRRFEGLEKPIVGSGSATEPFKGPPIGRNIVPNNKLGLNSGLSIRDFTVNRDLGPSQNLKLGQNIEFSAAGRDLPLEKFGSPESVSRFGPQDRPASFVRYTTPFSSSFGIMIPKPDLDQTNPRFASFGRSGGNLNRW